MVVSTLGSETSEVVSQECLELPGESIPIAQFLQLLTCRRQLEWRNDLKRGLYGLRDCESDEWFVIEAASVIAWRT